MMEDPNLPLYRPDTYRGLVFRNGGLSRGYTRPVGKNRTSSGMDFGVRVAAVVERGGALLLVRHEKPDRDAYWVLPGGRLEPGETIPECAVRELAEETGLTASFSGVLYVGEFLREGRHTIDVVARVTLEGNDDAVLGSDPEVAPGTEPTLREVRWVSVDELRGIELLPGSVKRRLLDDARGGWTPEGIYLGGAGG
jgi:8-oxo-dGTP diphosphatase